MAQLSMNRAQAFSPGAKLWIVPSTAANPLLLQRIDWYLNFQLSRARFHQPRALAQPLKDILTENELEILQPSHSNPDNTPLAVIAGDRLPTNIVVQMPETTPQKWIQLAHTVWNHFGKPNVRVFLSQEIDSNFFAKYWSTSPTDEVAVVSI